MLSIRKIGVIRRSYRHLNRYRQILSVLIKYGFDNLIDAFNVEQYFEMGLGMISRKERPPVERFTRAERLRMALEELGPTFVKLGQILATRPDLVSAEFVREFEKLQDHVPPFTYEEVREIIEKELDQGLESAFDAFDEQPLAAASVGQVHTARLKDGEKVVVKVQRPNIRKIIEVDLEIMLHLASLMERHLEEMEMHHPTKIVAEFARSIEREIDYTVEASHMERFAAQFQGDMSIYVPKVFRKWSTERVLTVEYIDGIKASEIDRIEKEGLDRKIITAKGADLILKQIFEHGFFHGDPHPGNIYVLPDNMICYLDYGMMGCVDRQTREDAAELIEALSHRDESKTIQALLKLVDYDEQPDLRTLERDVAHFAGQHLYKPLKNLDMGRLLQELLELLSLHRLALPQILFLMFKALTTWESVGRSLDPDFHIMERAAPFIRQVRTERMRPERIASDVFDTGMELIRLAQEIPSELRELLLRLKQGKLKMALEHPGLEQMLEKQHQAHNRVALSIVIAALVIASALLVLSRTPPFLFGISVIGIIGFVVAAILGTWLFLAIIRKGRL
jgi:ubiquinone biosynthesis protein